MDCRNSSSGSSTNEAPFRSTFSSKKGNVHPRAELLARQSFAPPKPVPRAPVKVKHFAILEENHVDPLKKKRRTTADPPDGRAPPGGMVTLPKKLRTASASSVLLDLDPHRRSIGERKHASKADHRHRDSNGASAASNANPPFHLGKAQELS